MAAYNFGTANVHFAVMGVVGSTVGGAAGEIPNLQASMGGALFRLLHEYGDAGIAQDALSVGFPSVMLAAIPDGQLRFFLHEQAREFFSIETDHRTWTSDLDAKNLRTSVNDRGYNDATPAIACPTIKAWCEAFGGTYTDLV